MEAPTRGRLQAALASALAASADAVGAVALQLEWVTAWEPTVGGYSHQNYRVTYQAPGTATGQVMVRIPRAPLTAEQQHAFGWEAAYLQALQSSELAPHGLRVATVLATDPRSGVLVLDWLSGVHLHQHKTGGAQARALERLADLHRWLPAQSRCYEPLGLLVQLHDLPAWLLPVSQRVQAWWQDQRTQFVPSHNDLNPYNLLWSDGSAASLALLDWEMAGLNHPGFDLVTAELGLARALSKVQPTALDGATMRLQSKVRKRFGTIAAKALVQCYWLREYAWAAEQLQRGNGLPGVAAQVTLALTQLQRSSQPSAR